MKIIKTFLALLLVLGILLPSLHTHEVEDSEHFATSKSCQSCLTSTNISVHHLQISTLAMSLQFDKTLSNRLISTEQKQYKNPKKEKLFKDLKNLKIGSILTEQTMIGIVYREILGASVEKLIKNFKFRKNLSKQSNISFFEVKKDALNAMYAIDQYDWLQKYFYKDLWENEGKKSVNFAFESFNELNSYLKDKNINLYIVVYPWPFELKDSDVREKYLNYLNLKFSENNLNNLFVYDEFLKGDTNQNIFQYYLPKDVHFNREGNLILKEKIYDTLLKDKLIK